jgi:hypothetical protein
MAADRLVRLGLERSIGLIEVHEAIEVALGQEVGKALERGLGGLAWLRHRAPFARNSGN